MELKLILEAVLFSAQKPLSLKELRDVFAAAVEHAEGDETVRALKKVKESELTTALEDLAKDHEAAQRSYRLACVAGSWQVVTQPEYAAWLKAPGGHRLRPPSGRRFRCPTASPRRAFPNRRWRRSPLSPTASRSRARKWSRCVA